MFCPDSGEQIGGNAFGREFGTDEALALMGDGEFIAYPHPGKAIVVKQPLLGESLNLILDDLPVKTLAAKPVPHLGHAALPVSQQPECRSPNPFPFVLRSHALPWLLLWFCLLGIFGNRFLLCLTKRQ